ncbi:MAG TPA: PilZ domain-containing protein [Terriglobales bacterium]|jgi:hypothetical protein|nr:PilZ domain-containing protein [Terriglobales bacterium]
MGCRRQPRVAMSLNATVCGMDSKGRSFLDRVQVLNLSRDGALLEDVSCAVGVGDQVALRFEGTTRRYRVMWEQSTADGRRVGLAGAGNAAANAEMWLPASGVDDFQRPRMTVRREHDRYVCEVAVEMRMKDVSTPLWVTASDLSEGGCRVQVPHAMKAGTEVNVALWIDSERVWVLGDVTHCIYGCGTGIRFKKLDRAARERIASLVARGEEMVSDRRETTVLMTEFYPAFSATS